MSITELSFGKEYTAAVEAKQVAHQEAQRAVFFVERAKQERQQKILQAEGEAEAAKMISFYYLYYNFKYHPCMPNFIYIYVLSRLSNFLFKIVSS